MASRKAGFVAAVSDRALIMLAAADEPFDHEGINPHLISDNCRMGSLGFWRMTGMDWVGAMLYLGLQSSSPKAVSKCSSMICFRRDSR